jgi:hypothetical protein
MTAADFGLLDPPMRLIEVIAANKVLRCANDATRRDAKKVP